MSQRAANDPRAKKTIESDGNISIDEANNKAKSLSKPPKKAKAKAKAKSGTKTKAARKAKAKTKPVEKN